MTLTNLQRFILSVLVEDDRVDGGATYLEGVGVRCAAIAERSGGWYARPTVQRCLNRLERDGLTRRLEDGSFVATLAGAGAVGL